MSNHYHLLLGTPEANLVDGMRWFQGKELNEKVSSSRRGSYHGEAIAEHDAKTAEKQLVAGLARLGLSDVDLAGLTKRDPRKQVLAWWIRKGTMARNDWLAAHLCMGHVSAVSKSVGEVARTTDPMCLKWKRQLERLPGITLVL